MWSGDLKEARTPRKVCCIRGCALPLCNEEGPRARAEHNAALQGKRDVLETWGLSVGLSAEVLIQRNQREGRLSTCLSVMGVMGKLAGTGSA